MTGSIASSRVQADTNVLVYAHDPRDIVKHQRAQVLIQDLLSQGRLVLSVQTLNEFYSVMTRPNRPAGLSHAEALTILRDMARASLVVPVTEAVVFRAVEVVPIHHLSLWDALIWAAAKENGVGVIYTEDFQDGREIEGVLFRNPFIGGPGTP